MKPLGRACRYVLGSPAMEAQASRPPRGAATRNAPQKGSTVQRSAAQRSGGGRRRANCCRPTWVMHQELGTEEGGLQGGREPALRPR